MRLDEGDALTIPRQHIKYSDLTHPPLLSPYMNSCARLSLVVSHEVKRPFLHESHSPQAMSKQATTRSPRFRPVECGVSVCELIRQCMAHIHIHIVPRRTHR